MYKQKSPSIAGVVVGLARGLAGVLGVAVHARVALASAELHQEKVRLVQMIFWTNAIVFLAVMASTFVSLSVVYLFWESARLAVLVGLASFYSLALLVTIIAFRRFLANQSKPFARTLHLSGSDGDRDAVSGRG